MLSLKRRISSLSLRRKPHTEDIPSDADVRGGQSDLIKAGLPDPKQPKVEETLPQTSATITPLINGIRDIIEDVFPMPSARHIPPELQRRLSTVPRRQSLQAGAAPGGSERHTEQADVLILDDTLMAAPEDELPSRQLPGLQLPIESALEEHRVLPSEGSLVWQLPQSPAPAWQRTQGISCYLQNL